MYTPYGLSLPVLFLAVTACSSTVITNVGAGSDGAGAAGGVSAAGGTGNSSSASGGADVVGGSSAVATGGAIAAGGSAATGGVPTLTGGAAGSGGNPPSTGGANAGGAASGGSSGITGGAGTGGTSATVTSTSAPSLLSQCTLLLHMDEPQWTSTTAEVIDASGYANNGTATAGATTGTPARFGSAGQFNGTGYVSIASSDSLHARGAFTLSAWIYPTLLDGSRAPGIVSKRAGYGVDTEFSVFLWSENRLFVDIMGEDNRFSSNAQFSTGEWYHVVVVFDGSQSIENRVSVYVNGQLDKTAPESSPMVTVYDSPVHVGDLPAGGQTFVGSIDEVAMWQRALSADEVLAVYQRASPL